MFSDTSVPHVHEVHEINIMSAGYMHVTCMYQSSVFAYYAYSIMHITSVHDKVMLQGFTWYLLNISTDSCSLDY